MSIFRTIPGRPDSAAYPLAALVVLLAAACAGPEISAPDLLPLDVFVTVTGDLSSELRIVLDGQPAAPFALDGGQVRLEVRRGRHVVELAGLAAGCTVEDGPRRVIDVEPGRASFVATFDVSCPAESAAG